MVVTRRAPAPPTPTTRTNSAQPIPRATKKAPQSIPNIPGVSSPLSNGKSREDLNGGEAQLKSDIGDVAPKKVTKSKSKGKKSKRKSSGSGTSFVELLTRLFLLWFTIYTLSVCPDDVQLKSPICRGLSEYRRLVIEPYIMPPIQHALAHPSVAPYVEKAKPFVDYAVRTTKPAVLRAKQEWNGRVIPEFNKRIVPLYFKYAAPQLLKVDAQISPYRARIGEAYERRIAPFIRVVSDTTDRWQHKARPYVVIAAHKTYDGYERARPYLRLVWEKIRMLSARLVVVLSEKRRQFVDPHVKKIWERVKELSSGKPKTPSTTEVRGSATSRASKASSKLSQSVASVASSLRTASAASPDTSVHGKASDGVLPSPSVVVPAAVSASEAPSSVVEAISVTTSSLLAETETVSLVSGAPAPLQDTAFSISAVSSTHAAPGSSAVSSARDDAIPSASSILSASSASTQASASSVVAEDFSPTFSIGGTLPSSMSHVANGAGSAADSVTDEAVTTASAPASASSVTQGIASGAPSVTSIVGAPHVREASDLDLDDFYAELGLGDDLFSESSGTESTPAAPVETETEQQREERLRLRRIETEKKRADIETRHTKWEQELTERIAANKKVLRKALVSLRKAAVAELKDSVEIRKDIDGLVEEAEKLLRGAEKYMATLQRESRKEEEKKIVWDKVVDKVDAKFTEKLHQTEAVVNGWYLEVVDRELAEVRNVVDEVRDIADRAQADVGLNYAWLDDVTYNDWKRYHDLLKKSDNFTALAQSIQDGTHPSPLSTRIKRNGERAFGGQEIDAEADDSIADESLPIQDRDNVHSPADLPFPPVVIGKSKEEVMDALNRVADQEGQATSSHKTAIR
ncbi:hypothetical protein A0H81_05953 [Grifola frondosa]|uniref:Uncharacterized protein n=1 Tax=Grifola frondosa TaxID=5627 RepID=A0A1C7MCZ8_GRIFR|nr:hypothetical protein A0H81_05953 [Grifola frondosa]